jgi:hypothetical protein
LLHYPVGFFFVAPLAIGWRFMVPLLFWSVHLGMDYLQIEMVKYSTPMETVVFAAACTGILFVQYRAWRELRPDSVTGLRLYLTVSIARTLDLVRVRQLQFCDPSPSPSS